MTRFTLVAVLAIPVLGLASVAARAGDPPAAPVADAKPAVVAAKGDYKPPPGFKTKRRKGETVYCRSRAPVGTRIKAEECFTEAEIKEVEHAMAITSEDLQQRGRMCPSGLMCRGDGQ